MSEGHVIFKGHCAVNLCVLVIFTNNLSNNTFYSVSNYIVILFVQIVVCWRNKFRFKNPTQSTSVHNKEEEIRFTRVKALYGERAFGVGYSIYGGGSYSPIEHGGRPST